jgi:hypothetical protein
MMIKLRYGGALMECACPSKRKLQMKKADVDNFHI